MQIYGVPSYEETKQPHLSNISVARLNVLYHSPSFHGSGGPLSTPLERRVFLVEQFDLAWNKIIDTIPVST